MFSTSTIASSTIMPITRVKASRVIVSRLKPNVAMTMNVPNRDIGIAKAEIRVAFQSHKKGKMMMTDKAIASNSASMVDWVASRI